MPITMRVLTLVSAIAATYISAIRIRALFPHRSIRVVTFRIIFWVMILTYGIGKLSQGIEYGPAFFRFHLNDFGFVATWGAFFFHSQNESLWNNRLVVANRSPITGVRIGSFVAMLAGIVFEIFTGVLSPQRPDQPVRYFDWIDTSMYVAAFLLIWAIAPRMWIIDNQPPIADAAPRPSGEDTAALGPTRPKPAPTRRTQPSQSSPPHRKRRKPR